MILPWRLVVAILFISGLGVLVSIAHGQNVNKSATWKDTSTNEEGFRFYGSLDKGVTWEKLADGPTNAVGITFQVPDSRPRCYTVTAFNSAGETTKSNMICEGAPRTPENLAVE